MSQGRLAGAVGKAFGVLQGRFQRYCKVGLGYYKVRLGKAARAVLPTKSWIFIVASLT